MSTIGGGGRLNRKKLEKNEVFLNLQTGNQILMKFDFSRDIVSQSSCFKSRPDLVTRGVGGEPKILENP